MSGITSLSAPSYMPTLFASASSDTSLLSALSGRVAGEPGTANPITAPEQARSDQAKPVALVAAQKAESDGDLTTRQDLAVTAGQSVNLVV
jgi:hypothetical protein